MQRKGSDKSARRGDASKLSVGIAVARFNADITEVLLAAAREELHAWKVKAANVFIIHVAGSFELPFACQRLLQKKKVDVAIALGCIIKGETKHDEYIAQAVFSALQQTSLKHDTPIGLGILTVNSHSQAKKRINYGAAAAAAALEAALV